MSKKRRRSPRKHQVHPRHPRYKVHQYPRGEGQPLMTQSGSVISPKRRESKIHAYATGDVVDIIEINESGELYLSKEWMIVDFSDHGGYYAIKLDQLVDYPEGSRGTLLTKPVEKNMILNTDLYGDGYLHIGGVLRRRLKTIPWRDPYSDKFNHRIHRMAKEESSKIHPAKRPIIVPESTGYSIYIRREA